MFAKALRLAMLLVNVWYFFIRRYCLPQCLSNLANTLTRPTNELATCFDIGSKK